MTGDNYRVKKSSIYVLSNSNWNWYEALSPPPNPADRQLIDHKHRKIDT